jgi:cold shock protein
MTHRGVVKWFDDAKGFGFIKPQVGGADLFVHFSSVMMAGHKTLNKDAVVEYEERSTERGLCAESVVLVDE